MIVTKKQAETVLTRLQALTTDDLLVNIGEDPDTPGVLLVFLRDHWGIESIRVDRKGGYVTCLHEVIRQRVAEAASEPAAHLTGGPAGFSTGPTTIVRPPDLLTQAAHAVEQREQERAERGWSE